MHVAPSSKTSVPQRRSFLKLLGALAGLGGVVAVWDSMFAGAAPIDEWVSVGTLRDLPEGLAVRKPVAVKEKRYVLFALIPYYRKVEKAIWIRRSSGGVRVFTATCPHKAWMIESDPAGFHCPGHKSQFDPAGGFVSGPALRGMDTLEFRIDDSGEVSVRFQAFQKGLDSKEVLS